MNEFATISEIRNYYYLQDIWDANEILSLKIQLNVAASKD